MRKSYLVLLLAVMLLASVVFGQKLNPAELVLWDEICSYNIDTHPNPNNWAVGDTMVFPPYIGGYVIVDSVLTRHPWMVTYNLIRGKIQRQGLSTTAQGDSVVMNKPERSIMDRILDWENRFWHSQSVQNVAAWLVGIMLLASLCYLLYWLYRQYRQRQSEKDQPPFVPPAEIPAFATATSGEATPLAQRAIASTYGPQAKIIGPIQKGILNGTHFIFGINGSVRKEKFNHEPGFWALVEFPDGTRRYVPCAWRCFNPVLGAKGSKFRGTFTPEGGQPVEIDEVDQSRADRIARNIALRAEMGQINNTDAAETTEEPAKTEPVVPEDMVGFVTEVQVSKGHVTFKGNVPMTPRLLSNLADRFTK